MDEQNRFSVFEVTLSKRRRKWNWSVCTNEGTVVMQGYEGTRSAARYKARRALFQLLASAPLRLIRPAAFAKHRASRHLRSS